MPRQGTLVGIGVGPGDPELLTLKAARTIQQSSAVVYPANLSGDSQARQIVSKLLTHGPREIPIPLSFTNDRTQANTAYDETALEIATILRSGEDVAVLCEGDPLLFGSFIYLQQRLRSKFAVKVIPGITSISAAAAASATPLSILDQKIAILPASADDSAITQALNGFDSIVFMKPGRHRPRLLKLLTDAGRMDDAVYVEQASREAERVVLDIGSLPNEPGPYFALILVTRNGKL